MKEAFDKTTRLVAEEALLRKGSGGGGGGGITQLTGPVTAGPGSGALATTITPGTNGQVLTTSGGVAAWETPAAGITQLTGQVTAGPGLGSEAATITPGTNGQVLTTSGGVAAWAAPPASGLNQLTGDVTAGPGTGSQVATFAAPQSNTLYVATNGNDTTGNGTAITFTQRTPRRRPSPLREVQQPETSGSVIFMPGVYSQNIALVPFVNLSALDSDQQHELRGLKFHDLVRYDFTRGRFYRIYGQICGVFELPIRCSHLSRLPDTERNKCGSPLLELQSQQSDDCGDGTRRHVRRPHHLHNQRFERSRCTGGRLRHGCWW